MKELIQTDKLITLRFTGNNIAPELVRPKEVAELITAFEAALIGVVKRENVEFNPDQFIISFSEIKGDSLGLSFKPVKIIAPYVFSAYLLITDSIKSNRFELLPNETLEYLKPISNFANSKNCEAEFKLDNEVIARFNNQTHIEIPADLIVKGYTTIYATLQRVGGKNPRAAFVLPNNKTISIEVSTDLAKQLAHKLYSVIGLSGEATWLISNYDLISFTIKDVLDYEQKDIGETFKILQETLGTYWDAIEDINEVLSND